MVGILYIVATPIGNLDDITLRAIDVLKSVAVIACEDTRHSKKLLNHFQINKKMLSFHEHNESIVCDSLLERLQAGNDVALVSDAGTPLISDPGYRLVHAAKQAGVDVSPIPGACAAIAALSVAGLPSHQFRFIGFLPAKPLARLTALEKLKQESATLIFYEAPHRLQECVNDMLKVFGESTQVCLARELTKKFETVLTCRLLDLVERVDADKNQSRGEIVLILAPVCEMLDNQFEQAITVFKLLEKEMPASRAVQLAAKISGVKKNQLYKLVID